MEWVILALLLLWSWRAKAENEAEITVLLYSYNGQVWLPLQGAVIDSSSVTIGVQWVSITASMGVTIILTVDGETQEEVLRIDPGDTGRFDFSMTLDDGGYTAEVTLKETASGKTLDSRLASFTVATAPPPPAEFVLSNLTVSPAQAQVEDLISTSVVVKNIGSAPGDYSILIICDELLVPIPKTGTLLPGESATLSASWIARAEGVHKVTVDSLSAIYEVVAAPSPAEFVLSDITISEETVQLGEWVSASVTATNIGAEGGNCTVTIERTGKASTSQIKFIAAGQQESVGWGWKPTILGTHTVKFIGPTNDLSGTFTVSDEPPPPPPPGPRPAKKGELEVISIKWIAPPPFMAPQRPQWEITLKNLTADRLGFSMMLQPPNWHSEAGWNTGFEIAGHSTDTFQASSAIPAEPGTFPGSVAFGLNWWMGSIAIETVQNTDALVPNQSPPEFNDWIGLKEFPVPHSNYGVKFDAIRLPMLSRSTSVQAEVAIYLLSPKDCQDWGEYAGKFGTERRLDLTGLKWCNPETEGEYTYTVIINVAGLEGSASKTLTRNDNSGIYTLPITLSKTSELLGARLPVSIRVYFNIAGGEYGNLHLLWSPDVGRYHMYCTLGYVNIGVAPPPKPPPPPTDYLLMSQDELYTHLVSGNVADAWWGIPDADRRELAKRIVEWWSVPIGPTGYLTLTDGTVPDWDPYTDTPKFPQWSGSCWYSVSLRYCIMDGREGPSKNIYYYRNRYDRWEQLWKPDGFKLPYHYGGISWGDFAHVICALQVGSDVQSFSSWLFFQYETKEIVPGDDQMPLGAHVSVSKITSFTDRGSIRSATQVAEWNV